MVAVSLVDLPSFFQIVLFLGAWIGHVALLVFTLNWVYGTALRRSFQHNLKLFYGVLVIAGPLAFWLNYGLDVLAVFSPREGIGRTLLSGYLLVCWIVGLGIVPLLTVARLLRRSPAVLLANHTQTVDIAVQLGYPPAGRGKYRRLACLPGNQVFRVDFAERTLRVPRLPAAWEGLTVLHLSDLHFVGTPDRVFFQRVMDRCRDWQPDLVALTGDIVDSPRHHRWILPVLGRLRWNLAAFAVLGNHDSWQDHALIRRRLRKLGIRVLGNGWETLEVRGEPLIVIGHEGPWFQPAPDLSACPHDGFRLCLSHTPDNIRWAQAQHIDLMLAGHVHGGQIRFPVIGSVLVPSRYGRRYDCGTFHEPPTLLHVTRGLAGKQPLRYNCRPEATLLVLRGPG